VIPGITQAVRFPPALVRPLAAAWAAAVDNPSKGVSMKRLLWTVAMAVAGFAIGWQDQGIRLDPSHVITLTVWFALIGYGFGSIFAKRLPKWTLLVHWALTMALVGSIFAPFVPFTYYPAQVAVAGLVGALLGVVMGFVQIKSSSPRHNVEGSASG
jgi:hypothetical protein